MIPAKIKIKDYNYNLPSDKIAKFPVAERDHSKLLIYNKGEIQHDSFYNIVKYLPESALMVFNNTRVIQARMYFRKETGALIEVFLLEPSYPASYEQMFQVQESCSWICMIGNLKKWKEGVLSRKINIQGEPVVITVEKTNEVHTGHNVKFSWTGNYSFSEIIDTIGELPIPPYLNRETEKSDLSTYQTVYSKIKGSVAAPTAGLHFTDRILAEIEAHGIERQEVTLHVGAGTFKPVKSEEISGHEMHTEYISVHRNTIERLIYHGGNAIAVGTTSVRTLESLYYLGKRILLNPDVTQEELHITQWEPYDNEFNPSTIESLEALLSWYDRNNINVLHSSTQIIIVPGYSYHIVKMLVTNFHQPQSTLLLLVSALLHGDWHRVYDYALQNDFRFLSYGDSSLLIP